MVCDLVKFYEGGLNFDQAFGMPLGTLYKVNFEASKIAKQIKDKMTAK